MVKNLPCNAGDRGSIPGQETKIPHAVKQLSSNAATTEHTHTTKDPMRHDEDLMRLNEKKKSAVLSVQEGA